jgi:hypothetical protein
MGMGFVKELLVLADALRVTVAHSVRRESWLYPILG